MGEGGSVLGLQASGRGRPVLTNQIILLYPTWQVWIIIQRSMEEFLQLLFSISTIDLYPNTGDMILFH